MSSELALLRKENAKLVAENAELKHGNSKLKQIIEENAEFKAKIMKLERTVDKVEKYNQTISQVSASSSLPVTSQLSTSSPIDDHSDKEEDITPNCLPELQHILTSSESKTSVTSDSAETLDLVETVYKEQASKEITERIRETKLRELNLSSDNNSSCDIKTVSLGNDQQKQPQILLYQQRILTILMKLSLLKIKI